MTVTIGLLVMGLQLAILNASMWDRYYLRMMAANYPRLAQLLLALNVLALGLLCFGR